VIVPLILALSAIALAPRSIADLYDSDRNDPATLDQAKAILDKLSYGADGYFFACDMQSNNLMHPRQPELVSCNLWDINGTNGSPTIQSLIKRIRNGGGFERYL